MLEIVFATQNKKKSLELKSILQIFGYKVLDLNDIGFTDEINETGLTLEENAMIKAKYLYEKTKSPSFGEDSGLEVEALGNAPGVFSARYAGMQKNDKDNIQLLLQNLNGVQNRNARFRTVIAYVDGDKQELFAGEIAGSILREPRGQEGFGYDPVFVPEGYEKSFAEIPASEKNKISHRANALAKMIEFFKSKKNPG